MTTLSHQDTMSSRDCSYHRKYTMIYSNPLEMEPAWKRTTGKNFPIVNYQKVTGNGTIRVPQSTNSIKQSAYTSLRSLMTRQGEAHYPLGGTGKGRQESQIFFHRRTGGEEESSLSIK